MLERLVKAYPTVAEGHLKALAEIWSTERDQVIARMLELCRNETGPVMATDARPEAILELAKLIIWLEERIIAKKLESGSIETIDVETERISVGVPQGKERIENTARLCADRIWNPFLDTLHRRFPLLDTGAKQRSNIIRPRKDSGVKNQHYSPSFSNEFWATGSEKLVRIYSRSIDGSIVSKDRGYRVWAREAFFYSQGLERVLQLIETDAQRPYNKLLDVVPLNEKERRCWIAFLLTQMLRTPSFVLRILPALKGYIKRQEIIFPVDPASLRQVYETLFSNNDLYTEFYQLITAGRWELWTAPLSNFFIRGDNPVVVVGGAIADATFPLLYPMTPAKCFVVSTKRASDPMAVVPENRNLTEADVQVVNRRIANAARRSVIAPLHDDAALKLLLKDALAPLRSTSDWRARLFPEFWGPVV
jgi:uncharacterized protein DUF4238